MRSVAPRCGARTSRACSTKRVLAAGSRRSAAAAIVRALSFSTWTAPSFSRRRSERRAKFSMCGPKRTGRSATMASTGFWPPRAVRLLPIKTMVATAYQSRSSPVVSRRRTSPLSSAELRKIVERPSARRVFSISRARSTWRGARLERDRENLRGARGKRAREFPLRPRACSRRAGPGAWLPRRSARGERAVAPERALRLRDQI